MVHIVLAVLLLCLSSCYRQIRVEEALALADSLYQVANDSVGEEPVMQSLLYYQRAIDAMSGNDTVFLARKTKIYTSMGELFAKQMLYQEAIDRYQLAYECAERLKDTCHMITAYKGIGDMYRKQINLGESVHYYDLAEQLAIQANQEKPRISLALRLATAFMENGRMNLALELLPNPPYQVEPEDEDIYNYVMWHIYSFTNREDKDSAEFYMQKLLESQDSYYQNYIMDWQIGQALANAGERAVYQLYKKSKRLQSAMSKEQIAETTSAVSTMYQALKMERQNAELHARNQQIKYYAIIAVLLLVLVVATTVIFIYRTINKRIQLEHTTTMTIRDSEIYQQLLTTEKAMNEVEQQEVIVLLNQLYPTFISSLQKMGVEKEHDLKVCLLLKMGFKPSRIASLVSRTDSAIANTRARLYKKVFGFDGKAEDWDKLIMSL